MAKKYRGPGVPNPDIRPGGGTGITRERDRKLAPLPRDGAISSPGATPPYKPGPVGRGDGSTNPPGTFRPPRGLRELTRERDRRVGEIPAPGEVPREIPIGLLKPKPATGGQRYVDRGGQVPAKIRQQYRAQGLNVPRAERMYYRSIAPEPGQERKGYIKESREIPIGLFKPKPGLRDPSRPYRGPGVPNPDIRPGGGLLFGTKPGTGPQGSIKRIRNGEIPAPGEVPSRIRARMRTGRRFGNIGNIKPQK